MNARILLAVLCCALGAAACTSVQPSVADRVQARGFSLQIDNPDLRIYRDPTMSSSRGEPGVEVADLAVELLHAPVTHGFYKGNAQYFPVIRTNTLAELPRALRAALREKLSHRLDNTTGSRLFVHVERCSYEYTGNGPISGVRLFAPVLTISARLLGPAGNGLWQDTFEVRGPKGHPLIEFHEQPALIRFEVERTAAVAGIALAGRLERWVSE